MHLRCSAAKFEAGMCEGCVNRYAGIWDAGQFQLVQGGNISVTLEMLKSSL